MKKLVIIFYFFFIQIVSAQINPKLAEKPPLGWNSFDSYGVYLHEEVAYKNLEAFAEKLQPHGYKYFVIDAGWWGEYKLVPGTMYPAERHADDVALDEYGRVDPCQVYFPNGLKPVIERAHQLGVKFGVHVMRGIPRKAVKLNLPVYGTKYRARDIADTTSICTWNPQNYGVDMDKPGAQEYYNSLYKKLAEWGIDFVKVDDLIPYPKEVVAIGKAIQNSGRPMVYSLSPGGNTNLKDLPYYTVAHMVRITSDIWDDQKSIDWSFDAWRKWEGTGRPGFWPDLDMIPFGKLQIMNFKSANRGEDDVALAGKGTTRMSQFTKPQMRTFITQRALSASPLMVGGDLPTMDDYSLALLTNPEMLACNQNGHTGTLIKEKDSLEVWGTFVPAIQVEGWIGWFNRTENEQKITITKKEMELVTYYGSPNKEKVRPGYFSIKDIWNQKEYILGDNIIEFTVAPDDVLFIHFRETEDKQY